MRLPRKRKKLMKKLFGPRWYAKVYGSMFVKIISKKKGPN